MDARDTLIQTLQNALLDKQTQLQEKEAQILLLFEFIKLQNLRYFASRNEKQPTPHGEIFNEDVADEAPPEESEDNDNASITIEAHQRKKAARKALPSFLPRENLYYDLSEEEKQCSCGCTLTLIDEIVTEQFEMIPQVARVLCHIRKKYACKKCHLTIKTASMPAQPIPKSMASPGLLAHIAVSKFCDHLPLYRQENIFKRNDIDLGRGTLSQWMIACGTLLQPLINIAQEKIIEYTVAYADESRLQVLKQPGKQIGSFSYMWVFGGGRAEEFTWIFHYASGRGAEVPFEFLLDFKGHIHVDAYAGYNKLTDEGLVFLVICMAHARRKFVEIIKLAKNKHGVAHEVVARMGKLYAIEKMLKENKAAIDHIQAIREEKSRPILNDLKAYLEEKQASVLSGSLLGKAIYYFLNHFEGLTQYLTDGRLEIDNNRTERVMKPFATGRKNWLFCDSVRGAKAAANIYSLIETCKFHHVNPYLYLKHVFEKINQCTCAEEYEQLLPYRFKALMVT